jgi:1-acyl-sn-glycerol-3-phosphate acyltransferase
LVIFFRSLVRILLVVWTFAMGFAELLITRPATRELRAEWLHRFCKKATKRFGIEITSVGTFPERGALITNHQSYIDILVLAALHRCVFVSKAEIAKWPVVGWMTTMAGTLYVHRGRGGSADRARAGMQEVADSGLPVVFFPEGTTTNGQEMLKFHSGILAQAMLVDEPVTAAYIQYSLGEGNAPGASVADDVAFWGDQTMWPHMWRFVGLRNVRVKVRFADGPIAFSSDVLHRKQVAVEAREAVLRLAPEGALQGVGTQEQGVALPS